MGEKTLFSSLEFGLTNHETMYSWRGPTAPVPYESNPRLVFERMFRGRKPIVPNWHHAGTKSRAPAPVRSAARNRIRMSRACSIWCWRMRRRPAAGSLAKATSGNWTNTRSWCGAIEKRVQLRRVSFARGGSGLEWTPGPSKPNLPGQLPPEGGAYWKFFHAIHRDPEKHEEYIRLMADLLVLAFQTDTTRVATVAIGSDEALFPGVATVGYERHCHTLEHQGNAGRPEDADPISPRRPPPGPRLVHQGCSPRWCKR